jgi:hypothetical protein
VTCTLDIGRLISTNRTLSINSFCQHRLVSPTPRLSPRLAPLLPPLYLPIPLSRHYTLPFRRAVVTGGVILCVPLFHSSHAKLVCCRYGRPEAISASRPIRRITPTLQATSNPVLISCPEQPPSASKPRRCDCMCFSIPFYPRSTRIVCVLSQPCHVLPGLARSARSAGPSKSRGTLPHTTQDGRNVKHKAVLT